MVPSLKCRFRALLPVLATAFLLCGSLTAQDNNFDPFFPGTKLQGYTEILLFWNNSPQNPPITGGEMVDLANDLPPDSVLPVAYPRQDTISTPPVGGKRHIAVAHGNFNGDKIDDVVAAWNGTGDSIHVMLPHLTDNTFTWSQATQFSIPQALGRIYLATGNLDQDREDEIVIVYGGTDLHVHINTYDTDGSLSPRLTNSIVGDSLFTTPVYYRTVNDPDNPPDSVPDAGTYTVAVGDFNSDDIADILLLNAELGDNLTWTLYGVLYDVSQSSEPLFSNAVMTFSPANYHGDSTTIITSIDLTAKAADLDNFTGDEIALAGHFAKYSTQPFNHFDDSTFVAELQVSSDLTDLTVTGKSSYGWGNHNEDLSLAAGDMNGDGKDEITTLYGQTLQLYESVNLVPEQKDSLVVYSDSYRYFATYDGVAISDMDADLRGELVVIENFWTFADPGPQYFTVHIYNTTTNLDSLYQKTSIEIGSANGSGSGIDATRHYAVTMGDFDGDRLRLGTPTYSKDSDVQQPLIILNSPPNHFDILDSVYDIAGCYNGSTCSFYSTYEKSTTSTIQVTTSIHQDWSMDATLTKEANAELNTPEVQASVSLQHSVKTKYGTAFSRVRNSSHAVTISVRAQATNADQVYGTVTDYETWEYPAYDDTGLIGHIVVVKPTVKESRWFPAKSWTGLTYVPNHEVGNILSYLDYDGLQNVANLEENIKVNVGDGFTLGPTTNFEWSLTYDDFARQEASTTHSFGLNVGTKASASVSVGLEYAGLGFTIGANVTGEYNTEQGLSLVSTQSTEVHTTAKLTAELGSIPGGNDLAYEVIPYSYWAKNGALVLDYAARPEVAPAGYPQTWWQQTYGTRSDAAFILPWRYEEEKGFTLFDPEKKFLSKEILLSPSHPDIGDTVTITARVHNYSLVPISQPVTLRFYVGNPDAGGVPISGIGQGPDILTDSTHIDPRGVTYAEIKWVLPPDAPQYAHIYAVLDPNNSIDEIHEDNNKAFAVLGNQDLPTAVNETDGENLPVAFSLSQNYPNPFNPSTTIIYSLPTKSEISLSVYNILGQRVATLDEGSRPAGTHEVTWNGRNDRGASVASGVYFYRLQATDFTESKKMLLLK